LPGTNTLAYFARLQVKAANLPIDDGRLDSLSRLVEEEVVVPRVAVAQAAKWALPEYSGLKNSDRIRKTFDEASTKKIRILKCKFWQFDPVSGFRFPVSGFWFLASSFWFLVSSFQFPVSGFRFPVFGLLF
jgi:hypothetical protein